MALCRASRSRASCPAPEAPPSCGLAADHAHRPGPRPPSDPVLRALLSSRLRVTNPTLRPHYGHAPSVDAPPCSRLRNKAVRGPTRVLVFVPGWSSDALWPPGRAGRLRFRRRSVEGSQRCGAREARGARTSLGRTARVGRSSGTKEHKELTL